MTSAERRGRLGLALLALLLGGLLLFVAACPADGGAKKRVAKPRPAHVKPRPTVKKPVHPQHEHAHKHDAESDHHHHPHPHPHMAGPGGHHHPY